MSTEVLNQELTSKPFRLPSFLLPLTQGVQIFITDFKYRYRRTFFGYWWTVVGPIAMAAPLIIVGKQLNFTTSDLGMPYEVYALSGVIFWNVCWESMTRPLYYSRRMRRSLQQIPVSVFSPLTAAISSAMYNFLVGMLVLGVAMVVFGVPLKASFFLSLFMCVPILILAGLCLGMPFVVISLLYHDIRHGLGFIGQVLLWSVPAVYEMPVSGFLRQVNLWNPFTYPVVAARQWMFVGELNLPVSSLLAATGAIFFVFWLARIYYLRTLRLSLDYAM